jgi:hypothetical protein
MRYLFKAPISDRSGVTELGNWLSEQAGGCSMRDTADRPCERDSKHFR